MGRVIAAAVDTLRNKLGLNIVHVDSIPGLDPDTFFDTLKVLWLSRAAFLWRRMTKYTDEQKRKLTDPLIYEYVFAPGMPLLVFVRSSFNAHSLNIFFSSFVDQSRSPHSFAAKR